MTAITSTTNAAVKAARKLLRRRGRDAGDQFLVEGPAVHEGMPYLERIFATADAMATPAFAETITAAHARHVEVLTVSEQVFRELADTVTARGVVGVARMPRLSLAAALDHDDHGGGAGTRGRRVLVADGVADPGNAGTLVRTADAAGFDAVIFTAGSVDPRNPKAVRATAGSLFHLPVADRVEATDLITACATAGLRLIGARAGAPTPFESVDMSGNCAIVIGNEAHGLTPVLTDALDEVVSIRMHEVPRSGYVGVAESLNLAVSAAVLMYESSRQRHAADCGPASGSPVCQNQRP